MLDSEYEIILMDILKKLKQATISFQLQKVNILKDELQKVLTKYMANKDPK